MVRTPSPNPGLRTALPLPVQGLPSAPSTGHDRSHQVLQSLPVSPDHPEPQPFPGDRPHGPLILIRP